MSASMTLHEPHCVARYELQRVRPRLSSAVRFQALWVAGDMACLEKPTVAVVGSRAPSEAGRRMAFETARTLSRAGVCIISGLALGIDGAAHEGAVDAGASTIGVLGGGHRCFHPRRNRALAERMIACGGAVVSPFPPDHAAYAAQFLQRNGIVAALADAVVIVEAAARSGALNTASWASDLGIPVFAFPGDVDRPKVAGCLALLRDGATLARGADDILEDLGLRRAPSRSKPAHDDALVAARSELESAVLLLLADGETDLDVLLERTGISPSCTMATLASLELEGVVERRPGQRFALAASGGKSALLL